MASWRAASRVEPPHPVDGVRKGLDAQEVHRAEVGQRLHDRQGGAGGQGRAGQRQGHLADGLAVGAAHAPGRLQRLAGLAEEGAPPQHVDVGVQDGGEDGDRAARST